MFYQQSEATEAYCWVEFRCFDDDAADAYVPKTGLTFSSGELVWAKAGAAAASATNFASVVEAGNGRYWYKATAAELNTLGKAMLIVVKTDVFAEDTTILVVPWDPYAVSNLGLTNFDDAISSRLAAASYQDLDDMLDSTDSIESGVTLRAAMRILAAFAAGKLSGARTGTETFYAVGSDTKARITSTNDSSGNRTSVTVDGTDA